MEMAPESFGSRGMTSKLTAAVKMYFYVLVGYSAGCCLTLSFLS